MTRAHASGRAAAVLAAASLLGACSSGVETRPTSTATADAPSPAAATVSATRGNVTGSPGASLTPEATSEQPSHSPSEPAPSIAGDTFTNPVIGRNFPDPHVIRANDQYFAYSTTSAGMNIRYARSPDLVEWEIVGEALPELATWSGLTPLFGAVPHEATWAPAVAAVGDAYVMYYTTPALEIPRPDRKPSQCIGVATSDSPGGPFVDESDAPIVCQSDLGGSIDATHFADEDGTQYLVWKNDGNCCGVPTRFFIQELSDDGLALVGEPTDMGVSNDLLWERLVIEAPTLWKQDGTYYLFYSGNDFASAAYAVGYATSSEVIGPYADAVENPILKTLPPAAGPGHQSIVQDDDGDLWMTYHAWDYAFIGYPQGRRAMWIDELVFENGKARVLGPDAVPQAVP
jgi:beta-xylosidase